MPDFGGRDRIVLQPKDELVPYSFEFSICSAVGANDGALPFGDGVAAVLVNGYDKNGDEDAELVQTSEVDELTVTVYLSWPAGGAGKYGLQFEVTTDNGATIEFDFGRVWALDK